MFHLLFSAFASISTQLIIVQAISVSEVVRRGSTAIRLLSVKDSPCAGCKVIDEHFITLFGNFKNATKHH
jgi:hypothetical protein